MASIISGDQVDNVTPADDLKTGWTKYNRHGHDYDTAQLTNKSGAQLVAGDVVALDTANDSAVDNGNTVGSLQTFVVAMETIANDAAGEFARAGVASCKSTGTIARGQYIKKSATAEAVEDAGTAISSSALPPAGTIGVALAAASGNFVTAYLFGFTVASGGATALPRASEFYLAPHSASPLDIVTCYFKSGIFFETSGKTTYVKLNHTSPKAVSKDTAGPAIQGRDQAGAFTTSTWVYLYAIAKDDGTVAGILSAQAPTGYNAGPAMPSGYTRWCFLTALYITSGDNFIQYVYAAGARTYYGNDPSQASLVTTGAATTETQLTITGVVPPNALSIRLRIRWDAAAAVTKTISIYNESTRVHATYTIQHTGSGAAQGDIECEIPLEVSAPYIAYKVDNATSFTVDIQCIGFTVSNGGE